MVVVYGSDPEAIRGSDDATRDYVTQAIDGEVYSTCKYNIAEVSYVELEIEWEEKGALYSLGEEFDELPVDSFEPHWHNLLTGEEEPGYFLGNDSGLIMGDFEDLDFDFELDLSDYEFAWDEKSIFIMTLIDYGVDAIAWFYNNALPRINLVPEGQETVEFEPW